MSDIQGFGDQWKESAEYGSYKHEYFFKYLRISPSYQLAYRKLELKERIRRSVLPEDFDKVLALYKKVGNVFDGTYLDWWDKNGKKVLDRKSSNKRILLSIDPNKTQAELVKSFRQLLKKIKSEEKKESNETIKFLVNKIRYTSLMDRMELIELIGMNHLQMSKPHLRSGKSEGLMMPDFFLWEENRNKKTEAWKLAKLVGFSTSKKKAIDLRGKKTSANVEERNYLSMLISKNKKVAFNIAENAARGLFPCADPIDSGLEFNYLFIGTEYEKYLRLVREREKHGDTKKERKVHDDPSQSLGKLQRKLAKSKPQIKELDKQFYQELQEYWEKNKANPQKFIDDGYDPNMIEYLVQNWKEL